MSSKNVIESMLSNISKHKREDRYQLLSFYVESRLNKSLQTYYKELLASYNILSHQNEQKVIKSLIRK